MDRLWEEVVTRLQVFFNTETLTDSLLDILAALIVGLIVFAGFLIVWFILGRILRASLIRARVNETAASFIELLARIAFLGIGAIYALSATGIDIGALVATLGIASLTIGFAAQDSLSNLISGLLIFLYQPFGIGDLIEVDDMYGRVDKITLKSTQIVTVDGKMLSVPNTQIINKTVASYTKFPHLRLDVPVTVGVNEDLDRIREILIDLVKEDKDFLTEPAPMMVVSELNDYNTGIVLAAWLRNERAHILKRFQLRERVFKALTSAGVEMPLETIQLASMDVKLHPNGK